MTATIMDGKALAQKLREQLPAEVEQLGHVGITTMLVGDDPASHIYIDMKHKAATAAGFEAHDVRLPETATQEEVLERLAELNADDRVDGILVQLPLPSQIDETTVLHAIDPIKDVDGLHPVNAGHLYLGTPLHIPATPWGCIELLHEYGIDPKGKNAVVIGRSELVGRPAAMLLVMEHATVTICHSRTTDLAAHVREADIVVAAVGVPAIVKPEMVKPGAAVLDVGVTRTDAGIVGDVDPAVAEVAGFLTPMPGGTGPMTIAMLLRSTLKAARFRRGLDPFVV